MIMITKMSMHFTILTSHFKYQKYTYVASVRRERKNGKFSTKNVNFYRTLLVVKIWTHCVGTCMKAKSYSICRLQCHPAHLAPFFFLSLSFQELHLPSIYETFFEAKYVHIVFIICEGRRRTVNHYRIPRETNASGSFLSIMSKCVLCCSSQMQVKKMQYTHEER